jgi:hypothetical protein
MRYPHLCAGDWRAGKYGKALQVPQHRDTNHAKSPLTNHSPGHLRLSQPRHLPNHHLPIQRRHLGPRRRRPLPRPRCTQLPSPRHHSWKLSTRVSTSPSLLTQNALPRSLSREGTARVRPSLSTPSGSYGTRKQQALGSKSRVSCCLDTGGMSKTVERSPAGGRRRGQRCFAMTMTRCVGDGRWCRRGISFIRWLRGCWRRRF